MRKVDRASITTDTRSLVQDTSARVPQLEQGALTDGSREKLAFELSHWHHQLQELQLHLRQQAERLDHLTRQLERGLKDQDEAETLLEDIQDTLSTEGLSEVPRAPYQQLLRRIRQVVREHVPRHATILVVSKGDPDLLTLSGRVAWHFPRDAQGRYSGYYPACSTAAIAQLEGLRALGAQYLLFPQSAFWWFEHYLGFAQYLENYYRLVVRDEQTSVLYSLREGPAAQANSPLASFSELLADFQARFHRDPAILDWHSGLELARNFPNVAVLSPPVDTGSLPYFDHSIDVVAVPRDASHALDEARRVAAAAVVTITTLQSGVASTLTTDWLPGSPPPHSTTASIIIPIFNRWSLTEACLESLFKTLPSRFSGEVLVVNDGSTDDTAAMLKGWLKRESRLRVFSNPRNLGFVDSCNHGASEANGEFLIFLNNDVVLLPGWMTPLLRLFRDFPRAGAVGGKLISPEGILQEAGAIVFGDGSAMNFGRGDTDIEAPLYNFVREVDYCSAALLATPRTLFQELGGFATEYRPGYYEDTDYCFRLRERGYATYYQPECAVVHREGGTAGRELSQGMKQYQAINRVKFINRWHKTLKHLPVPPRKLDPALLQVLAIGGRPNSVSK